MELNGMKTNNLPKDLRSFQQEDVRNSCINKSIALLKTYDEFAHKGTRGHAAIIAGSDGMMGAAILSAKAAIRSGAGKLTVIVPDRYFTLIHSAVPEALVCSIQDFEERIPTFNALAVGPGLGNTEPTKNLLKKLFSLKLPLILDADAINAISDDSDLLSKVPPGSLLTPHRLEAERLIHQRINDKELINTLYNICNKLNINILLKSHYSILFTSTGEFYVNGTGNSGMGKAGSGDVLTGLIAGLAAQGLDLVDAAILGACVHGLAGDNTRDEIGEDAMCASDLIRFLSGAFKMLRNRS